MTVFGLTGGIACGKSTITKTFRIAEIPVVDADIVARQVVEPSSPGLLQIIETFGKKYLTKDGNLNREKLGAFVFMDKGAMKKLNDIMGPLIHTESRKQLKLWRSYNKIVGYDAALIIEMGNADKYRPLIVVSCPVDIQIERLIKRNNLTKADAEARINSQMPLAEKIKLADFVIDTSGTIEDSQKQTLEIIEKLKALPDLKAERKKLNEPYIIKE